MNNQEAFDIMVERLREGGGRTINKMGDSCVLWDGKTYCVVGAVVSTLPEVTMVENASNHVYINDKGGCRDAFSYLVDNYQVSGRILDAMRDVHDFYRNWDEDGTLNDRGWEEVRLIADNYSLEFKEE